MIIPNYENYNISPDGEVTNIKTGRVLKTDLSNVGYYRITVCKDNKPKRFSVHRMVAMCYIPNPANLREVNHINGIKTDNRVENLEWSSSKDNSIHAVEVGLIGQGEKNYNARSDDMFVRAVCELIQAGWVRGDVLKALPTLTKTKFDDIRRRKTWKHVSKDYTW